MKTLIQNATDLMLVKPVCEVIDGGRRGKCTDIFFMPVIAWELNDLDNRIPINTKPVAVGSDNEDGDLKIVYRKSTNDWYVCNSDHHGNGKEDLIKLINVSIFLNEDEEENDNE